MDDRDRTRFGPPDDTPILPWYRGRFTRGFVALHPFFIIDGLSPAACESGSLILARSEKPDDVGLIEWLDDVAADRRADKSIASERLDSLAKDLAVPIRWQTIGCDAGFADHCELDRALRTHIGGLNDRLADSHLADRLLRHCADKDLFLPTEGRFEPTMQDRLMQIFARAGVEEVVAGDESGEEERLVRVESLTGGRPWVGVEDVPAYGAMRLFAPDRSLLIWVHWDSFYTMIFGTEASLSGLRIEEMFEASGATKPARPIG